MNTKPSSGDRIATVSVEDVNAAVRGNNACGITVFLRVFNKIN
jgi:hypothetical protein